ncbi:MAG: glucokinase, partial [Spirochaetia bacterium]
VYGRLSGAIALQFFPRYGVFLAGGVAAKNAAAIAASPQFAEAYLAAYSGNLRRELLATPLYIILDYQISLLGAAHAARRMLSAPK